MTHTTLTVQTRGKGLYPFTRAVQDWLAKQNIANCLLTVFIQHTSASLVIQENADPDVTLDLCDFFNRLVPEDKLEHTVNELVGRITAHSGPVLTMAKKAILGGMGLSLRDGMKNSMNIFLNELYRLEDSQEGLRALVEKRKPNWKNK